MALRVRWPLVVTCTIDLTDDERRKGIISESPPHMEQSIAAADLSLVKINKNQNGFSNLLSQHTYALRNYWFLRGYVF